jgi:catechol 2,3-dioxygenase-like lactoylglutathione lyase family enzyme
MLAEASIAAFVPVRDLAAAEKFFSGLLGLRVLENNGFALVLAAAGGATIRCALTPDLKPQPFTILGWDVPDIEAAVTALGQAGIQPIIYPHFDQDERGIWTAPGGVRIVWFNDPDGNNLSLAQQSAGKGKTAGSR